MRLLYHPRRALLGFETYVAPESFDRKAQPVDIYELFCRYYLHHRDARWIYSVTDATTATKPHGGTSYRYGYTASGVNYAADLADGDTITWVSGSTKRWVIAKHTSTGMMACHMEKGTGNYHAGAEWLYCGNKINAIATSDSGAHTSEIKYIHIDKLDNITSYPYCCHYNSKLTGKLNISHSVSWLGDHAAPGNYVGNNFYGCSGITGDLIIPSNIIYIARQSFRFCTGITGLTLSDNVIFIGWRAFDSCQNIVFDFNLPSWIEVIEKYAFFNCKKFYGDCVLPESLYSVGYAAFSYINFTSITSNSDTLLIDDNVLYDIYEAGQVKAIYGLKSQSGTLTIRDDCTIIGDNCFVENTLRTGNVEIPNTVTDVREYAFSGATGFTGNLTFESTATVTTLGIRAFWYCNFSNSLVIPDSVINIKYGCFHRCTKFTGLTLGSSVQSIEDMSFSSFGLSAGTLNIPASVITIQGTAFMFTNFSDVTSYASNYPVDDHVLYDIKTSGQIKAVYSPPGYAGNLTLKSGTTHILNSCFRNCTNRINTFTILSTVVDIAVNAIWNCGFNRFNSYAAIAPTVYSRTFSNYNKPLHILNTGTSGYDVAPWTNTAIFSSITADL